MAFSRDGRYLATGSDDGAAHVFDAVDGREVLRQPHKHAVVSVAFSADQRLASGSTDGSVEVTRVVFPDEAARRHLFRKVFRGR